MVNKMCIKWFKKNKDEWASVSLRLLVGIFFIIAGYPKLFVRLDGVAGFFDSLGIPLPFFFAIVVGIVEFFGGIAILLGLFTRPVALLQAIVMIVALLTAHLGGGYEKALLLLGGTIALLFLGGGKLSLDALLCKGKKH